MTKCRSDWSAPCKGQATSSWHMSICCCVGKRKFYLVRITDGIRFRKTNIRVTSGTIASIKTKQTQATQQTNTMNQVKISQGYFDSLTDWLSYDHWLIDSDSLTPWLSDSPTHWLTHQWRLTDSQTDSLIHLLTDSLTHGLIDLLIDWLLTDWLPAGRSDWVTD